MQSLQINTENKLKGVIDLVFEKVKKIHCEVSIWGLIRLDTNLAVDFQKILESSLIYQVSDLHIWFSVC